MFEILDPSSPRVAPNLCALGIMTKAPQAGKVKTRLNPPLTLEEAAELNACFLRDLSMSILQATQLSPSQPVAVYTPVGSEAAYQHLLPGDFFLLPQRGDDFTERLIVAAHDLFVIGFESVCLINSDSPTVPASRFAEAVNELAKPGDRVVLGPSNDGGYYLIGLKRLHRRLFREIDWSTERVLEQTKSRSSELGLPVHLLPAGSDVDDASALARLCDELLGGRISPLIAPKTHAFLRGIVNREGRSRIWPL